MPSAKETTKRTSAFVKLFFWYHFLMNEMAATRNINEIMIEGIEINGVEWSSGSFSKNDIGLEPSELKGDISKLVSEKENNKDKEK